MSRDDTIRGLRELADFLDAHPDVPINRWLTLSYSVDSTLKAEGRLSSADRRAEVDRVAAILGVEPRDDGQYTAMREFGPVAYVAASVDPGARPGMCAVCCTNPVRSPDAWGIAGRVCTPCLGDQADLIDPPGGAS